MNGYVMETRQVTKTYGSFLALDHVNIHVRKGCIYGLVGDNGAGKSTLLKLLAGQSFPTEGEIEILGKHGLKDLENVRKQMGCMIEQPGFFPNMTVEQTLKYYCIQKGIPDKGRILEQKAERMNTLVNQFYDYSRQSFPTEGEIEILGKHGLKDLENVRKQMGCMIEQPGFFPNMTVEQTLKYYCIQKGIPDKGRILEQKAERMNTLVNQFYDYSRLCAGDFKMEMEKTDLSRVLRESLMENFRILEEAHLKVEADLPSHPLWIMGNQPALERIFLNMFQNGGRYAESIFQIAVKEENQEIFISFTNDTKKLSPEDLPRLFDRFYIQDSARSQGGTGLGLTVARSLAEEMGGTLEVSAPELPEKEETQNLIVCFELKFKVWDFL